MKKTFTDVRLEGTKRHYFLDALSYIYSSVSGTLNVIANILNLGSVGDTTFGDSTLRKIYPQTDLKIDGGDTTHRFNEWYTKRVHLTPGSGTANDAKVGGVMKVNTTGVGNVGTGEDDLITYSIAANTLSTNGMSVWFQAAGTIANNINAKRIRVKLGSTTLFDTGAAGIPVSNAIDWSISGRIIRTGATAQMCFVIMNTNNATLASYCDYSTAAEDETTALTLKLTGEATTNNDVKQELLVVGFDNDN